MCAELSRRDRTANLRALVLHVILLLVIICCIPVAVYENLAPIACFIAAVKPVTWNSASHNQQSACCCVVDSKQSQSTVGQQQRMSELPVRLRYVASGRWAERPPTSLHISEPTHS